MDVNLLPPVATVPAAPGAAAPQQDVASPRPVIELEQIKTILYMGLPGRIHSGGEPEGQLVDVFA